MMNKDQKVTFRKGYNELKSDNDFVEQTIQGRSINQSISQSMNHVMRWIGEWIDNAGRLTSDYD